LAAVNGVTLEQRAELKKIGGIEVPLMPQDWKPDLSRS
jgi:hypothetical protein